MAVIVVAVALLYESSTCPREVVGGGVVAARGALTTYLTFELHDVEVGQVVCSLHRQGTTDHVQYLAGNMRVHSLQAVALNQLVSIHMF
jgi:hypothetical protein